MPKKYTRKHKKHRVKKGGDDNDIEMGPPIVQVPIGPIPPDPQRFQQYEKKAIQRSFSNQILKLNKE